MLALAEEKVKVIVADRETASTLSEDIELETSSPLTHNVSLGDRTILCEQVRIYIYHRSGFTSTSAELRLERDFEELPQVRIYIYRLSLGSLGVEGGGLPPLIDP
eukprot:1794067-Amphidinium_carterae.1